MRCICIDCTYDISTFLRCIPHRADNHRQVRRLSTRPRDLWMCRAFFYSQECVVRLFPVRCPEKLMNEKFQCKTQKYVSSYCSPTSRLERQYERREFPDLPATKLSRPIKTRFIPITKLRTIRSAGKLNSNLRTFLSPIMQAFVAATAQTRHRNRRNPNIVYSSHTT